MATSKPTQEKPKKEKSKKSKLATPILFVLLGAVVLWFVALYMTAFAKTDRTAQVLTVKKGDTYQSLLVKDKWHNQALSVRPIAKLYLKLYAKKPLHAGVYQIPANASLADVVKILQKGAEVAMVKVQLIEGKTVKDLYHTIKTTDGIDLEVLSPDKGDYKWTDVAVDNKAVAQALGVSDMHLEGRFAPNTYFFAKGTSDTVILKKLYAEQKAVLDKAWAGRADGLPYKTPDEALIMASIIEKETGIKSERNDVSAVFVNRLRQGMKLQTDPTIIYGLFDRYDGKIYRSNIDEKTDYNTYQIDGLPPTPIAMPSKEAIEATMHPSDVPYIYFVATGKGGHKFSVTLDEHNKAVADYRKAVAGK